MFYDNFLRICKEHGISPSRAAEACGINRSNVSNWKANGYTPRSDVLNKIADYFGVSVDYLLGNEQKKELPDDTDSELAELLEDFKTNPELRTLFSLGKNASPEDLRTMINVIKAIRGGDKDEHIC